MTNKIRTSKSVAKKASKILRNKKSSGSQKTVVESTLRKKSKNEFKEEKMITLDITKYVKPKAVFDFNFSTILLFRCTRKKYAESFVRGEIFFNQPKNWIQYEKDGEKGRGDLLEGTFFSTNANDTSEFITKLKKDKSLNNFDYDGYTFFRRKGIEDLYSICFYGVNDNVFSEKTIDEKGKAHYVSRVDKSYFTDFSEDIKEEEYSQIEESEKPVVLFINNPHLFFEKIKNALKKVGVKEEEILISPVEYLDKKKVAISAVPYPMELFLKDKFYSNQSEIRIIINSNNEEFLKYMKENHNIINIGNIEDITDIYEYYFTDLLMERSSKNSIIFNLPKPINEPIEDMSLERLLALLYQVYKDLIPQKLSDEEKSNAISSIEKCIKEKYNTTVYCDNENITIYNPNEDVSKYLDELSKPNRIRNNYEDKLCNFINCSEYDAALKEIDNNNNEMLKGIGMFYRGKVYEKQKNYFKAIEIYTDCIKNEIKEDDALSARSNCYHMMKKYDLALQDLDLLQDKIGYNHQIYDNKGINYFCLNKLKEAIEELNKSIEFNPNNPRAYYNRSVVYYKLSDLKKAKEDIDIALKLDPQNEFYNREYNRFYRNIK